MVLETITPHLKSVDLQLDGVGAGRGVPAERGVSGHACQRDHRADTLIGAFTDPGGHQPDRHRACRSGRPITTRCSRWTRNDTYTAVQRALDHDRAGDVRR